MLEWLGHHTADLMLLDLKMKDVGGAELSVKSKQPKGVIVVCTLRKSP